MPFIPHTEHDTQAMLKTIGVANCDALFDEIPAYLGAANLDNIPVGLSEMELSQLAHARAERDGGFSCFIGAGAYEHHIPAAVWQVATRGEFYTAYTPYQAEASQGSLQLIYEYQTMMARLMGMDISNASLYDGASALAEAILMAVRLSKKKGPARILMPQTVHPHYRETAQTILSQQGIEFITVPYDALSGQTTLAQLERSVTEDVAALVIPQPNFFGVLEEADALTQWARTRGILVIAVVNPLAMALLKAPGQWNETGVDIACGEGQPLGIPLAFGGPYYGFLCCRKEHVRQMPGRIVGRTVSTDGQPGFVLTLQAREQHIRRAKATSNICTNQGLMVTASTIYMSLMGKQGLKAIAQLCHARAVHMKRSLVAAGIEPLFTAPFFHEVAMRFEKPIETVLAQLAKKRIQGGYALKTTYPELGESLLLCATETKTHAAIQALVDGVTLSS